MEGADDDAEDIVHVPGQDDSLDPETGRRELSDERVTDRSDGQVVGECKDENEGASCPADVGAEARDAQTTNNHEDDEHGGLTPEIEGSATDVRHEEPRADCADEAHGRLTDTEGEGVLLGQASLLHEVGTPTDHGRAGRLLNDPCHDGEFSTSEVDTLEAVPVASPRGLLDFEFVGVNHHSECIFDVEVGVVLGSESEEGFTSHVELAMADKPPWGFWCEKRDASDGKRPDPLDSVGDTVGPFRCASHKSLENAGGE